VGDLEYGEDEWMNKIQKKKKGKKKDWNSSTLNDTNDSFFLMDQEKSKQKREMMEKDEAKIKIKKPNFSDVKKEEVDEKNEWGFTKEKNERLLTVDKITAKSKQASGGLSTHHSPRRSANVNLASDDDDDELNFSQKRHASYKLRSENFDTDGRYVKSSSSSISSVDPSHLRVGIHPLFFYFFFFIFFFNIFIMKIVKFLLPPLCRRFLLHRHCVCHQLF
jgi:hypothetical protein